MGRVRDQGEIQEGHGWQRGKRSWNKDAGFPKLFPHAWWIKTVGKDWDLLPLWDNGPTETTWDVSKVLCTILIILPAFPAGASARCHLRSRHCVCFMETVLHFCCWGLWETKARGWVQPPPYTICRAWGGKHKYKLNPSLLPVCTQPATQNSGVFASLHNKYSSLNSMGDGFLECRNRSFRIWIASHRP